MEAFAWRWSIKKCLFENFATVTGSREETLAETFSKKIFRNFPFLEHLQATVPEICLFDVNEELHGKVATILNLAKMIP